MNVALHQHRWLTGWLVGWYIRCSLDHFNVLCGIDRRHMGCIVLDGENWQSYVGFTYTYLGKQKRYSEVEKFD